MYGFSEISRSTPLCDHSCIEYITKPQGRVIRSPDSMTSTLERVFIFSYISESGVDLFQDDITKSNVASFCKVPIESSATLTELFSSLKYQ